VPLPAGRIAGDVDVDLHHDVGLTSSVRCVPHPALKDHPVHGCVPAGWASWSARARLAACDSVVLRPTNCRRPPLSQRPSSNVRGAAREPVTAPITASVVTRTR
jgi:hypothetical protein